MKKLLKKVLVLAFTLMFTISCTLNDSMFANAISESEENHDNICECGSDYIHDTHDGWIPLKPDEYGYVRLFKLKSGKYYVTEEYYKNIKRIEGTVDEDVNITLCLNGYTLEVKNIEALEKSKLTITDCKNKGKINFEYDNYDLDLKSSLLYDYKCHIINSGEVNLCGIGLDFKLNRSVTEEIQNKYLKAYEENNSGNSQQIAFPICIKNHGIMNIVNSKIHSDLESLPYYTIMSTSSDRIGNGRYVKGINIINSEIDSQSRVKKDGKISTGKTNGLKLVDANIKNSEIKSDYNSITGFDDPFVDGTKNIYIENSRILGSRTGILIDSGKWIINNSVISTMKEGPYGKVNLPSENFESENKHVGIYIKNPIYGGDNSYVELNGNTKVKGYNTFGVLNDGGLIKLNNNSEIIGINNFMPSEKTVYKDYDLCQHKGSFYINNDNIEKIFCSEEKSEIYLASNLKKEKIIQRSKDSFIVALDEKDSRYNGADIIIDCSFQWNGKSDGDIVVKDITDENKDKFKLIGDYIKLGYYLSKEPDEKEEGKFNLVLRLPKEDESLVSYEYQNSDKTKKLPTEILPKIPNNEPVKKGSNICPKKMENVNVEDGIWKFKGWIPEKVDNIQKNTHFVGTWEFVKNSTGGGTVTPKPDKPVVPNKPTVPNKEPDRIEGDDRIETAIEASEKLYPNGTDKVVLANAERFSDVLTANPFAVQEKASALLTYKDKLPEKTLKEIERLGAKKIYVSGGYEAVSKKVVDSLAAKGYEIYRFDGVDRYDTARKIAIKIREKGNTNAIELASGEDFPDALCMTPLAVKDNAPILLTKKYSIPKYTKQALAEWDIENIKIGGLEEAVSREVEKQIKSGFAIDKNSKKDSNVYDGAKDIKRIGGANRYETSAKLAAESYPESKLGVYATGEDFPDALIAGNYAGRKEAPVLLVKRDSLPEVVEKYTTDSKIERATIIGGVNAVSDKVFNLIKYAINR